MLRSLSLLVLVALAALGAGFVPVAKTSAQSDNQLAELAGAARQAQQLFAYAAVGEYNAMYDLLHPDAQAVLARSGVIAILQESFIEADAARAQTINVSPVTPWTWGVSGVTYDSAADIQYVIPVFGQLDNDNWVARELVLVQDPSNIWRWFIGSEPSFIDEVIAAENAEIPADTGTPIAAPTETPSIEPTAVAPTIEPTAVETIVADVTPVDVQKLPTDPDEYIEAVVNDIDAFWRDILGYTDYNYQTPGVIIVPDGDKQRTACGPAETGFWGFYCPGDVTIYLDEPLLTELIGSGQDFSAAFVIAHEWAHHIQSTVGIERVAKEPSDWNQVWSIELELQADCFAGVWARDAETRGILYVGDLQEAIDFTLAMLGDPRYIKETNPQAHGTGEQRATSITNGYRDGFLACNVQL